MLRHFTHRLCAAAGAATAAGSSPVAPASGETAQQQQEAPAGPSMAASVNAQRQEYAAAYEVKKHCTVALTKFKSGHGDLFLHRGRAYLELGQPYFALADFRAAAAEKQIGSQLDPLMDQALSGLPKEQLGFFESADNYLGHLVNPMLSSSVEIRRVPGKGRGLFAKQDINAGDLVVKRTDAWISYPLKEGHCAHCGGAFGLRRFACSNEDCHEEYCSRDCRVAATQTYHGGVCQNMNFQNLELELYAKLQSAQSGNEYNSTAVFLLLLRVYAAALTHRVIPSALPQVRTLAGRILFSPETLASSTLDFYQRIAAATETRTTISYEEFVCSLAKLTANVFQEENTIYVNIPRAMLNHSCDPNVADTGGELIATRGVKTGDELCLSYYPYLNEMGFINRRRELEKRGFHCLCAKCTAQAAAQPPQ